MQGRISKEVDYLSEAYQLFILLANGKSIAEKEKEMLARNEDRTEEITRMFGLLKRIEKEAGKVFRGQKKEISFYFKYEGECEEDNLFPMADFLLLTDTIMCFFGKSPAQLKKELEEVPEEEYCKTFGGELQRYGCNICDFACEEDKTPADVAKRILKMKLPDEIKLNMQEMFWNREEHREKMFELLERGVDFLHQFEEELQEEAGKFYQYWKERLKTQDFFAYVKEELQLDVGPNELGYEIWVSIIGPNRFSYSREVDEDGNSKRKDLVHMGSAIAAGINPLYNREKSDKELEAYAADVLKVLGDRSKFEILSYIKDKSAYGSELAKYMGLTTATISHHMNALILSGLVEMEKENNRIFYRENKQAVKEVLEYCRKILLE